MIIDELLAQRHMTRYRLAVKADVPHATLSDICSGKTKLEKCSSETVYKIARALDMSMEVLVESGIRSTQREQSYEERVKRKERKYGAPADRVPSGIMPER